MRIWYYSYFRNGQKTFGAVSTPPIPGLEFAHVRDQLIIPYLCAQGVGDMENQSVEPAAHAPGAEPVSAENIADAVHVNGVRRSLIAGCAAEACTAETAAEPERKVTVAMPEMQKISSKIVLRPIARRDLPQAAKIWNEVVAEGISFPGDEILTDAQAWDMFTAQTATVCAMDGNVVAGVYILHPNNIGRCAHISNASYAVGADRRGQGIGRVLVEDCIQRAKTLGFRGLQFNAVVASNTTAIALYLKLGFAILGTVPGGYHAADGSWRDTLIFLKTW